MQLQTKSNGFKPRTGSYSLPARKIRYVLQNPSGRFLCDLGTAAHGTYDRWVEDPNDAMQWAAEDAASSRQLDLQWRLGRVCVVEIELILNRHGKYDWLIGGPHECA